MKDKSTQQYVFHDENQVRWHKSVQDLPPGQIIDIPYLKQLAVCDIVPIAYCKNVNIDTVNNFVPAYLLRLTRHLWQLLDEEDYILSRHYWDEGDNSVLKIFGYFGGTSVAVIEQGSPGRSPREKTQTRKPNLSSKE